jgi:PIN domain nuclease of toxin-antitoxin system
MDRLYVIDTVAVISFFHEIFEVAPRLSGEVEKLVERAFSTTEADIKLSIPSVVFVEIFEKWFKGEEFAERFHYDVFERILQSPNIEIKPIEREVLENLLNIGGNLLDHDVHDKIILASAIMLHCPLITTDEKIIQYVKQTEVIPKTIS